MLYPLSYRRTALLQAGKWHFLAESDKGDSAFDSKVDSNPFTKRPRSLVRLARWRRG